MPLEARDCAPLNCSSAWNLAGRAKFGGWLGETRLRQRHTLFLLPAWSVGFPTHTANTPCVARSSRTAFQNFARVFFARPAQNKPICASPRHASEEQAVEQLAKAPEARGAVHEEPALSTPSEEESGEGVTRSSRFRSDGRDDDGSVELVEEAECRPWERREAAEDLYASLEVSLCHGTRCFRRQGEGAALERKASSPTTEPPFEVRGETWDYRGVLQRGSASAATSSSVIRRYFRRTDRLVSAYTGHDGISLTPAEVAYVTRKYSSHRRIPAEELAEIVAGRKA